VPTFAPSRWIRLLLKSLGPGVITGAADDDPSGIATYSVAGAQLGTKLLWTALLTWPLMAAVQMMCARIGKVTGQGLAANFKQRFPSWLLRVVIVALLAANTIHSSLVSLVQHAGADSRVRLQALGALGRKRCGTGNSSLAAPSGECSCGTLALKAITNCRVKSRYGLDPALLLGDP
jgi:hypothetical protein